MCLLKVIESMEGREIRTWETKREKANIKFNI